MSGIPGGATAPPGGMVPGQVPGDVHAIPGKIIDRIASAIGKVGTDEHIRRVMSEFPLDSYRDADGKVRCPLSQEQRDRLKSAFDD